MAGKEVKQSKRDRERGVCRVCEAGGVRRSAKSWDIPCAGVLSAAGGGVYELENPSSFGSESESEPNNELKN
jgi:hypothetical protein